MKYKIFLALILLIAVLTRLPLLNSYPNGFSADEAQQGYSAYSILKTGKDEWGDFMPINPRGFGDFKPPLYTYLTVPFVALFGLTIESVRLPAAVVGVFTVLVAYYLAALLFQDKRVSIAAAFLLAISPWHIQMSRTAFEGGLGIFFFMLGLVFFVKTGVLNHLIKLDNKYLFAALFFWGLTIYTYPSFRLFILLFIAVLFIYYRKQLSWSNRLISVAIIFLFLIPIFLNFSSASTRLSDVGITNEKYIQSYFEDRSKTNPTIWAKLTDNKYTFIAGNFLDNYLSYFSASFYFTGGRPAGSYLNFPGFPLFYFMEMIFVISAVVYIFNKKVHKSLVIFFWIILAPIAASLTLGSMHVNRASIILPAITILSGLGFKVFADFVASRLPINRRISALIMGFYLIIGFLFFLNFYFYKLPQKPPESLRFGYEQVFKESLNVANKYNKVIFDKDSFSEPQIFVGFYEKTNPNIFQEASRDWLRYEKSDKLYVDQLESWNLGKYYFESVHFERNNQEENILLVAKSSKFPENTPAIYEIKSPLGGSLYKIVPTSVKNEK